MRFVREPFAFLTTLRSPRPRCIVMALAAATAGSAVNAAGSAAAAQEPPLPDSVIRAAPLRVDAVRTTATAGSASTLHIDLDSLRAAPAATMDQVLRDLPLVAVGRTHVERHSSR